MSIETLLKYLSPGDFVVLFAVLLWSWFLYKNFGRKIMEDYDKKIDEQNKKFLLVQSKESCIMMQTGCQRLLLEKMDKLDGILGGKIEEMGSKIDLVLDRQTQVITRIDSHVNGHNHK